MKRFLTGLAAAMHRKPLYGAAACIACLLLASVLVTSQLSDGQRWPKTHEGLRYLYLIDHFRDAVRHGVVYPRVLPNAFGGYGYPVFVFYQPGFFFASLPLALSVEDAVRAARAAVVILFWIGGIGAFLLCSRLADRLAGLFCGLLFLFTPYLYVNLYLRGDLSEMTAMLLSPWPFFFLLETLQCTRNGRPATAAMAALGGSLAAVIYSHPATALFLTPAFCLTAACAGRDLSADRGRFLMRVAMALLLGITLSAPYWLTLFQMKPYVDYGNAVAGYYSPVNHVVYPRQLFSPHWAYGISIPGPHDGMSFQLGLPHFLLAVAGFLLHRRSRLLQGAFVAYLLLILMMTPAATLLWKHVPLLKYVQFPWRILSVTAILQVVCISGVSAARLDLKPRILALATLCLLTAYWHSSQFHPSPSPIKNASQRVHLHRQHAWLSQFNTYAAVDEFTPKTAATLKQTGPRRDRGLVEISDPSGSVVELPEHSPYDIHCRVNATRPAEVTINQAYFPGWQIEVNGRRLPRPLIESELHSDGRMRLSLPEAAPATVVAYYDGPPGWRWRNAAMLAALLLFGGFCVRDRRTADRKPSQNAPAEQPFPC